MKRKPVLNGRSGGLAGKISGSLLGSGLALLTLGTLSCQTHVRLKGTVQPHVEEVKLRGEPPQVTTIECIEPDTNTNTQIYRLKGDVDFGHDETILDTRE